MPYQIIKYFFNNFSSNKANPSRYVPLKEDVDYSLFNKYKNKILKPSSEEINRNLPSRSAKLRYAIRNENRFIYPDQLASKFKKYIDIENFYAKN